jgi:uncharacterized protein YbjT (DUF2867 family)
MSDVILVTGGTGTLGRHVIARLQQAGRPLRVLSRRPPASPTVQYYAGDLATGAGVDQAVQGVAIVIHCAGSPKGDDVKAHHLVQAAQRRGVRHLVNISVVGADRIPMASGIDRTMFGYYGAKFAAERIVEESGIGWTTMRATQFHSLIMTTVRGMAMLPLIPVPSGFRFQPVDAGEVADRLVELALAPPAGLVAEFGGPRTYTITELLRSFLTATGRRRLLMSMPMPGQAARALREGANLAPHHAVGRRTWEEHLAPVVLRHTHDQP